MKQQTLTAYASSFVSFLLEHIPPKRIDKILIFGSATKGSSDKESDIDIFIDTKKDIEKEANKTLRLFNVSEIRKKWKLKGITQDISLKVGELRKWKLRRDIISDSIILYGKNKEMPEDVEYYLLVQPSFTKFNKTKKVQLWRKLNGYKQKVNKKVYETKGMLQELSGKKIEHGILVPMKNKKELIDFLNKEKVSYTLNEVWSDTISSSSP